MSQVEKIMRLLECSKEEAENIIASDKAIDKGEKLFELNQEQKKAEKKMRSVGIRTVNAYGKQTTRERPQDRHKRFIIDTISRALTDHLGGSTHEITNPEREIIVEYQHRKFKIMLSAPRT